MSVAIKGLQTMLFNYGYDQLSRLVNMNASIGFDSLTNQWGGLTAANKYGEVITYDANGNILTYNRDGDKAGASLAMDRLQYNYLAGTNQLGYITDGVPDATYVNDLDGQTAGNYNYDAIGNLIKDTKEGIANIEWTVYGKLKRITKNNGVIIDYTYDATGYRISKTLSGAGVPGGPVTTWYVRDAQGNTLSTYIVNAAGVTIDEQLVYGSERMGIKNRNLVLNSTLNIPSSTVPGIGVVYNEEFMRGMTQYELSNHLGNVLATITDRKVPHLNGGAVDYYEAEVVSAQDYYPFGMVQPGRSVNTGDYRYGFNGKENDNEVKGLGNQQDYGMRIYDPRVGRFLSVDPLFRTFSMLTPYQFASNTPIAAIDLDGLEAKIAVYGAGVHRNATGAITERHESQFKTESDRDVSRKNATISVACHTGVDLVRIMEENTTKEGSIEYLSIASHAGPMGIILDNGQYGLQVVGHKETNLWTNSLGAAYTSIDIDDITKNVNIKFANNALVVFAGCNAGRTVAFSDNKTPIYSVAKTFTEKRE